MRTSQEFSVAIHALLMLNNLPEDKITSEEISISSGCNPTNVRKIFAKLRGAGLIITKSGKGRTTLAKSADQITMWDIFCAVEGDCPDSIFTIHSCQNSECKVGSHIPDLLTPHYQRITDAMRNEMSSVTLSDLGMELDGLMRDDG